MLAGRVWAYAWAAGAVSSGSKSAHHASYDRDGRARTRMASSAASMTRERDAGVPRAGAAGVGASPPWPATDAPELGVLSAPLAGAVWLTFERGLADGACPSVCAPQAVRSKPVATAVAPPRTFIRLHPPSPAVGRFL